MTDSFHPDVLFDAIQNLHLPRYAELPEIELYMDQVIVLMQKYLEPLSGADTEKIITSSMINNYVKQGILPSPQKKRYNRDHIARLIIICTFKQVLPIPSIQAIMQSYLKRHKVPEMYDRFAETYELLGSRTVEITRQRWQKLQHDAPSEEMREDLVAHTAILASVNKILIERLFDQMQPSRNKKEDESTAK